MENDEGHDEFSREFSEESFWKKLGNWALAAGRKVAALALTLYYCMRDGDTPAWARGIIVAALGYFILPADAIADIVPVAGFTDDLGALAMAAAMVAAHIKPEHRRAAEEKLRQWFGRDAPAD